jgi:carnitine O-acetyltransferase
MKLANDGQGVDRHLMGLQQLAIERGLPMPQIFEDPAYTISRHWRLSTSHCGSENLALFIFGPVVDDGFGLGYMIHDNNISVSITSRRSCSTTNSRLFATMLELSFLEMRDLAQRSSKL